MIGFVMNVKSFQLIWEKIQLPCDATMRICQKSQTVSFQYTLIIRSGAKLAFS